ncbi:hypothetical protein BH23ACT5_BH23ACT5_01020 [soil metagenome]
MRMHTAWLAVVVMTAVACSTPETTPPTTADPGATTTPTAAGQTTAVDDPAAVCNGYLVLLRSGDDAPLREALVGDSEILSDLDVMLSSEGEFAAIAEAALRVEAALREKCEARFAAGVEPAPDDDSALITFFEAVIDGDEAAGAKVAWANVTAQFSPWASTRGDDLPAYTVDGGTGFLAISRAITVACRAEGGVVVSCVYQE